MPSNGSRPRVLQLSTYQRTRLEWNLANISQSQHLTTTRLLPIRCSSAYTDHLTTSAPETSAHNGQNHARQMNTDPPSCSAGNWYSTPDCTSWFTHNALTSPKVFEYAAVSNPVPHKGTVKAWKPPGGKNTTSWVPGSSWSHWASTCSPSRPNEKCSPVRAVSRSPSSSTRRFGVLFRTPMSQGRIMDPGVILRLMYSKLTPCKIARNSLSLHKTCAGHVLAVRVCWMGTPDNPALLRVCLNCSVRNFRSSHLTTYSPYLS